MAKRYRHYGRNSVRVVLAAVRMFLRYLTVDGRCRPGLRNTPHRIPYALRPEHDVFFKVTSRDQAQKSPSKGHFQKDLDLLLEPAQTRLREAFRGNPSARDLFMYPDGVDHLHITTVP